FQSASDLAFALEALSSHSEHPDVSAAVARIPARRPREWIAWLVAAASVAVLVIALALGTTGYLQGTPPDTGGYRSTLVVPVGITKPLNTGYGGPGARFVAFALSPDGRRFAFVATDRTGRTMLWVRTLDTLAAEPLAGTEDAIAPFWSPDSRFIGYFTPPQA